jgi:subtilisin family serine protease
MKRALQSHRGIGILLLPFIVLLPWTSSVSANTQEREYLVFASASSRLPDEFSALVAAAGGTSVRELHEIGIAVARSSSPSFEAALQGVKGIADVVLDNPVDWLSGVADLSSLSVLGSEIAAPAPAAHNPASAAFFPFQWNMQVIQADDAWAAGFTGNPDVKVAILDSGIDPKHIEMVGKVSVALSANFTSETSPPAGLVSADFPVGGPFHSWIDYAFHGTHVAATVATNGIGTSGVAPHVTLIAVKVLDRFGDGTFGNVISGIMHAADVDADIIVMSIGAAFPRNCVIEGEILPSDCARLLAALNKAITYASRKGALVISAAGNSGMNADSDGNIVWLPAQAGNGMAVSATGRNNEPAFTTFDAFATYSNFGHSLISVAAPGGSGGSFGIITDRLVLGPCSRYSTVATLAPCRTTNRYILGNGTSVAAPHAAGVAALIDSIAGGAMTAAQLRTRLQQTADDLGKPGADPFFGRGRVNACRAVGVCP